MVKKDLSIIIPVSRDKRIFECLNSIDYPAEIIVVINGTYDSEIKKNLSKYPVKVLNLKKFGFGKFYNLGIKNATGSRILFMDSDSTFIKGAIKKMYNLSKKFLIVKGLVIFNSNSFESKITAKAREFTTSDVDNLYIPGPLFKKEVFSKVGFFSEKMEHCADAEMDLRIRNSEIKCYYSHIPLLLHPALTFAQDLKSGYNYGCGRAIRYNIHKIKPNFFEIISEIFSFFIEGSKKKGIFVGIYLFIWKIMFNIGFLITQFSKNKKIH